MWGFLKFLFIFILGCVVSLFLNGLFSSCGEQRLLSRGSAQVTNCRAFSCCEAWAPGRVGSGLATPRLHGTGSAVAVHGLTAPCCVGSSWTRDQSCVSCIGQQIFVFTTELPGKPSNARFTSDHLANSISLIRDTLIYSVSKYLLSVFLGTMIDTGYYLFSVTLL